MRNVTETVKHLLIINGIFFLATITLGNQVYDWFALHYPENPKFEIWQPLTHMFMHGDVSHIFFNMFGLWMFGTPLEQMWGKQKFIFFYLSMHVPPSGPMVSITTLGKMSHGWTMLHPGRGQHKNAQQMMMNSPRLATTVTNEEIF